MNIFFKIIGQFTLISAHTLILLGMSVAIKINSHAAEITCSGLLPVLYLVIITHNGSCNQTTAVLKEPQTISIY